MAIVVAGFAASCVTWGLGMPIPSDQLVTYLPWDVIMISGALPVLPQAFLNQLSIGGRLLAIIGEAPVMNAKPASSRDRPLALASLALLALPATSLHAGAKAPPLAGPIFNQDSTQFFFDHGPDDDGCVPLVPVQTANRVPSAQSR